MPCRLGCAIKLIQQEAVDVTVYVLVLYHVPATGLYSNLDELGINGKLKQIEPVSIKPTNRFKNYAITN